MSSNRQDVFQVADELFRQTPDWVTFFREVLGVDGIVRRSYPDEAERAEYEKGEQYQQIQQMLASLREKSADVSNDPQDPIRVITVRLPQSLHETLKAEAHGHRTSMNKLCITKLLKVIEAEPAEPASREEETIQANTAPAM